MTPDPVVLRRFESPDDVKEMPRGRFEIVRPGGVTIGRANSWVVGDAPYVSLHFLGADHYAKE